MNIGDTPFIGKSSFSIFDSGGDTPKMYEKLKEEKKQLEQQIKAAAGDKEKVKVLEKKLAQIEGKLSQKDNDTYRRKNAVIS